MNYLTEPDIEQLLIEQFQNLGYAYLPDVIASPDGSHPERESYSDVILTRRLKEAIARLNPTIPPEARDDAYKKIIPTAKPNLIEENRRLHQALIEGIDVEFYADDGTIRGDKVYAIDFANPENNDWLVLNQFTIIENSYNRRPDVVVFINGLPIAVIEIKNPSSESATLTADTMQLDNGSIQSTGKLLIQPLTPTTTIGLGGASGTLNLNTTELNKIQDGFSSITIGRTDGSGAITVGAHTFSDNLILQNPNGGGISINGALSVGTNNLTLKSGGTVTQSKAITANGLELLGSGTFTLTNTPNPFNF